MTNGFEVIEPDGIEVEKIFSHPIARAIEFHLSNCPDITFL